MKTVQLLLTADIHQHLAKWEQLASTIEQERPDFVLIAGDLFPKTGGFQGQRDFFTRFQHNLARMRTAGARVLLMLGNDDFQPLESMVDELAAAGLCVNMNAHVHRESGLTFCGVAQVRDYPFAYKAWCVADGDYVACPVQFAGNGLTITAEGRWIEIANLREYLLQKPAFGSHLDALVAQLTPAELPHTIWLVHQPPTHLGMDLLVDGEGVGSPTLLEWIKAQQPLLGISGHIHESPYQRGGRWAGRVQASLWFQPGQMGERLHYVNLQVTPAGNVRHIRHSIFGPSTLGAFERFPEP
jgi:Icc-related predicted phosphoesterase